MYDCRRGTGTWVSVLYFIAVIVSGMFMVMNLCIAIILGNLCAPTELLQGIQNEIENLSVEADGEGLDLTGEGGAGSMHDVLGARSMREIKIPTPRSQSDSTINSTTVARTQDSIRSNNQREVAAQLIDAVGV